MTKEWDWFSSPLQGPENLQPGEPRPKPRPKPRVDKINKPWRKSLDEKVPSLPASDEDYRLILKACKSGFRDISGLLKLRHRRTQKGAYIYPAMEWLHPFTLYSTEKNKGDVEISKKFNKLYKSLVRPKVGKL